MRKNLSWRKKQLRLAIASQPKEMKTCFKCKEEKPLSEFYKEKTRSKDGLTSSCISCISIYKKNYYKANREKIVTNAKVYRETNKEELEVRRKAYREINKEKISTREKAYYKANKEKISIREKAYREINKEGISARNRTYYQINKKKIIATTARCKKLRYNNNPVFKLSCVIGQAIRRSLKAGGFKKTSRSYKTLGCSFEKFKTHIENQFEEGMTWKNHGKWELDHIAPVSLGVTEEEIISLNHYSNFQPLWAEENGPSNKGDKLIPILISPENKIRYAEMITRNEAS